MVEAELRDACGTGARLLRVRGSRALGGITGANLVLSNGRIGLSLRMREMTSRVGRLHIDVGAARVATLDDDWPSGWGGARALRPRRRKRRRLFRRGAAARELPLPVTLNLDGFVYERFADFPAELVGSRWLDEHIPRLAQWLEKQENAVAAGGEGRGAPPRWLCGYGIGRR